ncbi:MAG TPA: PilN domain-containing protein, partial [Gemmatimonadaceae bacterium]|nr:PilN domain-containing protein [Gemmatimonadaceae bacterium]
DSVVRQVELIKSFDKNRYVWPHLMDEISRALPPYTWLTSVAQSNVTTAAQQDEASPSAAKGKKAAAPKGPPPVDTTSVPVVRAHIIGQTVDIQALTRFMKLLEASPFIQNVTLVKSSIVIADGKEVTEFQLDASYQAPDPSAIKSVPVSLSVR